ncbi:hypothetical protein [Nocardioides flavescens]|uniref:Ig-like domain (Group 3) n=1 Tax=Nocardioides flavescens TaxID=2691959 RepID=A0A6L7ESC1_9ACTN|nr:hypothetical protein [Nocardioides flavescens]MXG89570.1 hypothetical protein [Nocardioides flavescens]
MSVSSRPRCRARGVTATLTAALTAAATLTIATAAPASAASATVTGTYTCSSPLGTVPLLGGVVGPLTTFKVPATYSLPSLPDTLTANVPVPAGIPVLGTLDLSGAGLGAALTSLQVTSLRAFDGTPLAPVGVTLAPATTPVVGGVASLSGTLGGFTPGPGALPVPVPTSFDIGPATPVLGALGVHCDLDPGYLVLPGDPGGGKSGAGTGGGIVTTPGGGGYVNVGKQTARIRARGAKVLWAGHRAAYVVTVTTSAGQQGAGRVTVRGSGAKVAKTLRGGRARVVVKGLRPGTRVLRFAYAGNDWTEPATRQVKVRVLPR